MKMKSTYNKSLAELQAELAMLDNAVIEPLERLNHTLPLIAGIINAIKKEVLDTGFQSTEEEIHFFKVIKPGFIALQLFELEWHSLSINKPVGTTEMIRAFYEQELLWLIRFFRNNAFHYQYYRHQASELDHLYFLREAKPSAIPVLDIIDPAPGYSTALDYLFAKFIAYERIQLYLIDQLTINRVTRPAPKLQWTGEKINLVELVYGIHHTGQVNDGKAEVMEIMDCLGKSLGVELSPDRTYRMFLDIKRRKTVSPTRFIDRMAAEVKQHIEDSFGLKKARKNR
jgi:hypothetical protein